MDHLLLGMGDGKLHTWTLVNMPRGTAGSAGEAAAVDGVAMEVDVVDVADVVEPLDQSAAAATHPLASTVASPSTVASRLHPIELKEHKSIALGS